VAPRPVLSQDRFQIPDDVLAKIKYMHSYEKLKEREREREREKEMAI
jgi:hypothetical protein